MDNKQFRCLFLRNRYRKRCRKSISSKTGSAIMKNGFLHQKILYFNALTFSVAFNGSINDFNDSKAIRSGYW